MPIGWQCIPGASRALELLVVLSLLAAPSAGAQATWLVHGDWLQASSPTVGRSTIPSTAAALERRTTGLAVEFGYLRAVRELSTVQGGYAMFSRPVKLGAAWLYAGAGVFVGGAQASADTTGFNYVLNGQSGYQSRYTYSNGAAYGGGVQLSLAFPFGKTTEVRASVSEWGFGGDPVKGDNMRLLAGIGISLQLPKSLTGGSSALRSH